MPTKPGIYKDKYTTFMGFSVIPDFWYYILVCRIFIIFIWII